MGVLFLTARKTVQFLNVSPSNKNCGVIRKISISKKQQKLFNNVKKILLLNGNFFKNVSTYKKWGQLKLKYLEGLLTRIFE